MRYWPHREIYLYRWASFGNKMQHKIIFFKIRIYPAEVPYIFIHLSGVRSYFPAPHGDSQVAPRSDEIYNLSRRKAPRRYSNQMLRLGPDTLWRKLILTTRSHSPLKSHDHRWGLEHKSTGKLRALPSGSTPSSSQLSSTVSPLLLTTRQSAYWSDVPSHPHSWTVARSKPHECKPSQQTRLATSPPGSDSRRVPWFPCFGQGSTAMNKLLAPAPAFSLAPALKLNCLPQHSSQVHWGT